MANIFYRSVFICFCLLLHLRLGHQTGGSLVWYNITQPFVRGALCNDFTGAGYFIRKVISETELGGSSGMEFLEANFSASENQGGNKKWVIFLEGGGGCTSPVTCNERFIDQDIRRQYREFRNGVFTVDVEKAWNTYKHDTLKVISKLMTTLWRFSPLSIERHSNGFYADSSYGQEWKIEGRDILSKSKEDNPDFYNYNHVLVPYCSSDLWLKNTNNFRKALSKNFTFQFRPDFTEDYQFTFRGVSIFKSVIEDLYSFHSFGEATEVLLAGSSAGGLGALNHASWLNNQLRNHATCQLRVFIDSAWFINFKGEILNQFAPSELKKLIRSDEISESCTPLNKNYEMVKGRQDEELNAVVACVSPHLFLLRNRFPMDVPLFSVFSRYDLYLLSRSIASVTISEVSWNIKRKNRLCIWFTNLSAKLYTVYA